MSLGCSVRKYLLCVALASVAALGCAGLAEGPGDGAAGELDRPSLEGLDAAARSSVDAGGPPDAPAGADAIAPPAPPQPGADGAAGAAGGACLTDSDCRLVNDCCSCQAIPRDGKPPSCDPKRSCVMTVCAQYQGVDRAQCAAGRCVLGFDCDTTMIACKRLPPVCPAGQVPQVVGEPGVRCYGECVDARECLKVPPNAARER